MVKSDLLSFFAFGGCSPSIWGKKNIVVTFMASRLPVRTLVNITHSAAHSGLLYIELLWIEDQINSPEDGCVELQPTGIRSPHLVIQRQPNQIFCHSSLVPTGLCYETPLVCSIFGTGEMRKKKMTKPRFFYTD